IMTAFYTFRMIGMTFFGGKSKHIEKIENEGHHVHEVGKVMWVPFGILAVATIAVGVSGFLFEEQLHHLFEEYLGESFGIHQEAHATERVFLNLNPVAAAASFGAFGVGAALGYLFYIARKADPAAIGRNIVTKGIWTFLYNRWYLNTALYWGAVIGPMAIYRFIWRYFESTIIDGINPAFQGAMTYMSRWVKGSQTGITQTYLFVFGAGILVVVMLLLL
ncbi:MAG TPA: NADH-quinone oxidoreductase subunit L, partial [Nitrososphaera sp.]